MATQLEIINMALDLLDEEVAIDESDNRPAYQLAARNYANTKKLMLRLHPWNFAMAEAKLEDPTVRAFGWAYEYDLPEDYVRLLPLRYGEDHNAFMQKYELRKSKLLTNESEPVHIRYVQLVDDADMTDPLFLEALAARLAMRIAHAVTRKNTYVERTTQAYREAMQEAGLIDSFEGYPEDANGDYWENARNGAQ